MKGKRIEFKEDAWERDGLRKSRRAGELTPPQELVRLGGKEFWENRNRSKQSAAFIRYLLSRKASKKARTILPTYVESLQSIIAEDKAKAKPRRRRRRTPSDPRRKKKKSGCIASDAMPTRRRNGNCSTDSTSARLAAGRTGTGPRAGRLLQEHGLTKPCSSCDRSLTLAAVSLAAAPAAADVLLLHDGGSLSAPT